MNVMGIDPGLRTAYSYGSIKDRSPTFGMLDLPGFDDARRPRAFGNVCSAVQWVVRSNAIELVILEASILGMKKNSNPHKESSAHMLSGAIQAGASNGGAKTVELWPANSWRKEVFGEGFPNNPKRRALDYVKLAFGWDITDDNVAESGCLWHLGVSLAKRRILIDAAR